MLTQSKDLYSEICLVIGQDTIDMMIDSESTVTDIDALVTKPDDIIDQREVRMSLFTKGCVEVRSVDWVRSCVVFGTNENLLFGFESLKKRRSPEQLSDTLSGAKISGVCAHPSLSVFYTASTDGLLQMWEPESRRCAKSRHLGVSVCALDLSPLGDCLVLATADGRIAVRPTDLEETHRIRYRGFQKGDRVRCTVNKEHLNVNDGDMGLVIGPAKKGSDNADRLRIDFGRKGKIELLVKGEVERPARMRSVNAIRFSPDGHLLAVGTAEGMIDFFDVHGRIPLTAWASRMLEFPLDPGGLEIDCSDGVLLCKLIELVLKPFIAGRSITELKSYAIEVERPPSVGAWKDRPRDYISKASLMEEGLQIAFLACSHAAVKLESMRERLDDPSSRETLEVKEELRAMIDKRLSLIRGGVSRFKAAELVGDDRPVDRTLLFDFLRFLQAMDLAALDHQRTNLQARARLIGQLQEKSTRIQEKEKEKKSKLESVRELSERVGSSKSALMRNNLQHTISMEEKQLKKIDQDLSSLKRIVANSTQRYDELNFWIERAKEEELIFLGEGVSTKPHTKPVTSLDWSADGLTVQSASLDSGELNFWQPSISWQSLECNGQECWQPQQDLEASASSRLVHSCPRLTATFPQIFAEDAANRVWWTHSSPFGWSVKGLTRFECMDKQYFTRLARGPVGSESHHLLGLGDATGRVLVSPFPFPYSNVKIKLLMAGSFDSLIGDARITVEIEDELVSELAVLLETPKQRISLVDNTGPTMFTIHLAPPLSSEDRRSAMELALEASHRLYGGEMRSFSLLQYCREVKGPSIVTSVGHSGPVFAAVFDGKGNKLFSVGTGDQVICIWRLLRPEDEQRGRWIHDRVKSRVRDALRQALTFVRLGDGHRIRKALADFLCEWDVAKSGIVPEKMDPVEKRIMGYKTDDMVKELSNRGINILRIGLMERDELAARLCTAITTPETMTVSEIRAELTDAKVSSHDVFERDRMLELLQKARQDGTEFPRPIPFLFEKMAPAHEAVVARARATWSSATAGRKSTKSLLAEKQARALEVLDAVTCLDMHEAQKLGVEVDLRGLVALIQGNRLEIAGAIARGQPYEDVVRKGIDINNCKTKDPNDVDWLISGSPPDTDADLLKKSGRLYELAVSSTGGTLLPGQWYTFKDVPGRDFQYIRYDENGEFVDMLYEKHMSTSFELRPKSRMIPGLKRVRWGAHYYAKISSANAELAAVKKKIESLQNVHESDGARDAEIARLENKFQELAAEAGAPDNKIKAQNIPVDAKQDSQKVLPTAYLYQAPMPIPRLHNRLLPSTMQVHEFFSAIDAGGYGSVSSETFKAAVAKSANLFEGFGLPMTTSWEVSFNSDLIFAKGVIDGEDELAGENRHQIQGSDLADFLFPNVNLVGHLIFKVKIVRQEGEIKIGLIDCSRIVHGAVEHPLAADWAWKGSPTWYLDTQGGLYQFGVKVGQASQAPRQGDVVVADLDQDMVTIMIIR